MMGADADPMGVFRMKKNCNKCFAMLLAGCFLFAAGCGSEGGRSVNSKNAVEDTIQGQIAAEEQKTARATETVTETVTEADTVKSVPTEAATTNVEQLIGTTAAATEAMTEAATEKQKERSPEEDKKMMEEIKASYVGTPDTSVDIDLTVMDKDMVYSTIYQMVYVDPDAYVGKTFKAAGTLTLATSSVTGLFYPYVVIKDALACCQQGVEFQWGAEQHTTAEDFPAEGTELVVIGRFETYREEGDPYLYSRLADAKVTVIGEGEQNQ